MLNFGERLLSVAQRPNNSPKGALLDPAAQQRDLIGRQRLLMAACGIPDHWR
jgi:hypothetical protein